MARRDDAAPFFRSRDGRTVLYGRSWFRQPRNNVDVLLCTLGRHRVVQWGQDTGVYAEVCSCGARRAGPGSRWAGGHPRETRWHPDEDHEGGPFWPWE